MIAEAGDRAARRFLDFFAASIENDNTRMAYYRAVCSFFAWLEQHGIGELADIEPFHVAAYLKALRVSEAGDRAVRERTAARPTVKQHLAAIRMLFDWLVVGQVLAINPAHAVRGPKHVVKRGKTPVLSEDQARRLLASIKVDKKLSRPRRLASGSAVARRAARPRADRRHGLQLRAHQRRRRDAGRGLFSPTASAGGCGCTRKAASATRCRRITSSSSSSTNISTPQASAISGKTPLFRSAPGRTGILTDRPMHRVDAYQMVRRRTAEAGLKGKLGCHVFRATGITAYLEAGGTLENAQAMAAHESPRTTKLYDRTGDEITLDEVERIQI